MSKFLVAIFVVTFCVQHVRASSPRQMGHWGAGGEIGGISSVSLQNAYGERSALTLGVGTQDQDLNVYIDHLWYLTRMTKVHPYLGIGAGGIFDDDDDRYEEKTRGVLRLPIGLSYYPQDVSLNLYAQVIPTVDTESDSDLAGQIGLRYFFKK